MWVFFYCKYKVSLYNEICKMCIYIHLKESITMFNKENVANPRAKVAPMEARSTTNAAIGRRTGSALIDAVAFIAVFFGLNFAVVTPIMDATVQLSARIEQTNVDMKNSSLYIAKYLNADGEEIVSGYNLDLQIGDTYVASEPEDGFDYKVDTFGLYYPQSASDDYVSALYPEMVCLFYTNYRLNRALETGVSEERAAVNAVIKENIGDTPEAVNTWYKTEVLRVDQADSYFVSIVEEEEPSPKIKLPSANTSETDSTSSEIESTSVSSEDTANTIADFDFFPAGVALVSDPAKVPTYDQLSDFYKRIYQAAVSDLNAEPDHARTMQLQIIAVVIPFLLASAIVYLLFPLIFKHGASLGKLALKLGVVNTYGFKALWWQHVARFFGLFIFELLLTLLLYFIAPSMALLPIFISFTLVMFGKKHRAVHDFIAGTKVIDLRTSLIYRSAAEEDEFNPVVSEENSKQEAHEEQETLSYADRILPPPPAPVTPPAEATSEEILDVADDEPTDKE